MYNGTVPRVFVAALWLGSLGVSAHAATFTVTKLVDTNDGFCDADCSVREAVIAANAAAGADTVVLKLGVYVLSLAGANENASATGDLDVTGELTIQGRGSRGSEINAGGLDRVLHVQQNATLTVANVTVRDGLSTGSGGGILNEGSLTVRDSLILGNRADFSGGGISSDVPASSLVVERVLVAGNTAVLAGGGMVTGNPTTIVNTTFHANASTGDFGGGLYAFTGATVNINNSTFTLNSATTFSGGGLLVEGGATVTVANTLLAGNSAGSNPECSGGVTSQGYNLVRDASGCTGFTATGDQAGTGGSPINAQLAGIAANGGLTDTVALLPGSPALDAGNPATSGPGICASTDQRGLPRTVGMVGGSRCDIGAFADEATFADGFQSGDLRYWIGFGEVVP